LEEITMNTKRILIGLLTGALLITGCASNALATNVTDDTKEPVSINPDSSDIITIGIALEINEDNIHVISGDLVDIYNIPKTDLEKIYLGQTVALKETSEN
jgi:PBP1b-binding outer membrane lipoprotein LpoB